MAIKITNEDVKKFTKGLQSPIVPLYSSPKMHNSQSKIYFIEDPNNIYFDLATGDFSKLNHAH